MAFKALYVHIPFCLAKCHYCDFVSFAVNNHPSAIKQYKYYLQQEASLWHKDDFSEIRTIYFGGGTPTVMDIDDLIELVVYFRQLCGLVNDNSAEITVECNPGTIDAAKLYRLRQSGVNRLSIGAQSFCDETLRCMGRLYKAQDCLQVIKEARAAGFKNISIDLIYGLPNQKVADWLEQLKIAVSLYTEHISVYGLTVSPTTAWGRALAEGRLPLPDSDCCADMLEAGRDYIVSQGYKHYEIANFALEGYESRHNLTYWRRWDYLPLGVSASGLSGSRRWSNHRDIKKYIEDIKAHKKPIAEQELLSAEQVLFEAVFLGLRLLEGIDLQQFFECYQVKLVNKFSDQIKKMRQEKLLQINDGRLRLTPKGLLLANEVFVNFL
ncbi:MAG: radical SAM family heme chaperone HemW [Bacillota bacterium]|jgi:oxygen-independent coproporphyrinogen-3 oxidase